MRFQNTLFILLIAVLFTGCGSCDSPPKNKNSSSSPVSSGAATPIPDNSPDMEANNQVNTEEAKIDDPQIVPDKEKRVEAVTLKPVIEQYCAAMRNGDNVSLEGVFSKKALASMKKEMQKENIATLVDYLKGEPVGNVCQVVNEEIQGNRGEAEVITETYEDGTYFVFVKENNEWKMTDESEELDRVEGN